MSRLETTALLILMAAVAAGMVLPAAAMSGTAGQTSEQQNETVDIEVGQQLSTVATATTDEVRSEADQAGFEQRFNETSPTDRAEAIAERADELETTAIELRTEYDELTESYRNGEIDASTYAQRIASLTTKANAVEGNTERLAGYAAQLPDAERRAFNITEDDFDRITNHVSPISSRTASAMLAQYTAEAEGEIEIEIERADGVELEVTSEDGEQSRQFERPRDGSGTYELSQSDALDIATDTLSEQDGEWVLTSVGTDDGAYEFEFELYGAGEGEAEVAVDGETGTVYELEEAVESEHGDDDDERLAIQVTDGEPAPGEDVTLTVTASGEPVADATVELNEEVVGTTSENGTVTVTLPNDDADIEVTDGEREGELEFEYEDEEDDELGATADIDNGTVTVSVLLDGEPVEGASITANEESVGVTDADGTASFSLPAGEELEIVIQYQDLEGELEYDLEGEEGDDDRELDVSVIEGEPVPGEEVTLTVTADGEGIEGATVELNDEVVGETGADGTITVTLPAEEADIDVTDGDSEGELELEFDDEEEESEDEDDSDDEEAADDDDE